jgi:hypothetical protein
VLQRAQSLEVPFDRVQITYDDIPADIPASGAGTYSNRNELLA